MDMMSNFSSNHLVELNVTFHIRAFKKPFLYPKISWFTVSLTHVPANDRNAGRLDEAPTPKASRSVTDVMVMATPACFMVSPNLSASVLLLSSSLKLLKHCLVQQISWGIRKIQAFGRISFVRLRVLKFKW